MFSHSGNLTEVWRSVEVFFFQILATCGGSVLYTRSTKLIIMHKNVYPEMRLSLKVGPIEVENKIMVWGKG